MGELTNAVLSDVVSNAVTNLLGLSNSNIPFDAVNVVASVIGKKLAGAIWTPDTVGGQLGASLGASLGAALAGKVLGSTLTKLLGASLAGPVGIVIGTLLGSLLGGVIGSLFGGTPRSGADVSWDPQTGRFAVKNIYSRKGGSKDAAEAIAGQVASNFNSVLDLIGGRLADASLVQSGNYGMRKSDFVYRSFSTRDKSAISARFTGKKAGEALANYGTFLGLSDRDFQIIGGDNYTKRALYATLKLANSTTFDFSAVVGNLTTAAQFSSYIANKEMIDAIISLEPNSVFAIEIARTLVNAVELGLNKRADSDWFGGFSAFFAEMGATNAAQIGLYFDVTKDTGQLFRVFATGSDRFDDTIDILGQDEIEAGDSDDTISVEYSASNALGIAVAGGVGAISNATGLKINGAAQTGRFVIDVAANIYAGGGSDTVHGGDQGNNIFGGAGDDVLYGGRLDDWILGGAGDDVLDAGSATGGIGGNGNLLDGGEGNDIIRGREGSDWLEGGDGVDIITGGAGDDILSGGAGDGDDLKGGSGADQYLLRRSDGADVVEEDASGAPVPFFSGNAMFDRILGIETWKTDPGSAFAVRPDWNGSAAGVDQGAIAGGEDAVVFGAGIDIGDIRLKRSDGGSAPGDDLIIEVMQTDEEGIESFSGTQLTIRGWFSNAFKRVEWLKFADGNEIRIGDVRSFIVGGFNDDLLIGTDGNDFVYGGAGNDQLLLLAGDDIGNGASGNDKVWGDEGRDLIIGGTGVDELIGGAGADAISGDAGADDIYGGADNDVLSGGRGDGDVVIGGAGDDIFKFARGDGRDMYLDELTDHWDVVWSASGNWNSAAGFNYNTATGEVTGPGGAILRKNFGTAAEPDFQWVGRFDYDSASGTLKYFNPPVGASITANSGTDMIEFALGINIQDVILRKVGNDLVMAISNDSAEVSDTSTVADSITIKDWYLAPGQIEMLSFYATGWLSIAPGDTNLIAGTDGVDGSLTTPLSGTVLADWITAGAGDDFVAGGSGNDIIAGNSGSDTLRGEAGDDVLYGGAGNDILEGGPGRDILIGGSGTDTASYASASGAVRVRLSFQTANTGDAAGDEYDSIENIIGGSAADNIGGDEGENEITGGAGADTLMGGGSDDTYVWSATSGADTIREGAFLVEEAVTAAGALADGYSTTWTNTWSPSTSGKYYWRLEVRGPGDELVYNYALFSYAAGTAMPAPMAWNAAGWLGGFAKTNGQQVTRDKFDTSVGGGDQDTIEFTAGISLTDLTFIRASNGTPDANGADLIVRYGGSAATQITIEGHFTTYGRVETLQFHDGLSVSLASILSATSGAALNGTAEADLIVGQSGVASDLLYGGAGDDVLSGLAGDDQLYGEDGDDVLEGGAGADRLDGGGNAADGTGDTVRYVNSSAVTIDLGITTAQSGGHAQGDTLFGIENVVGSQTGGDTITGDGGSNIIDGLDGDNVVDGKGGDDVLISGSGNDILRGDAGEDNISAGDGNDQLWGGGDDDVLVGGGGGDQLRGEAGNDQLLGGDGNDTILDGGAGDDEVYGGAGNDNLTGGDGNDRLGGGTGNDTLHGGAGDDYYFVQSNDGADTIVDAAGTNIIGFDTGISHDRIWLTRSGSDLKVGVIGENTVLTVSGFFAASSPSRIKSIQTSTHAIFLDHPDTLNLITAMTAVSATAPATVPQTISDAQKRYWHEGGKAKPIAPTVPRAIAATEDVAIMIDGNYGVVDHDNDVNGYQLKPGSGPSKGVISNFDPATGALTYTPDAEAKGTDSFIVIVTDANGHSIELPVNVTIASANDAPGPITVKGGASLAIVESTPGNAILAGTIVGELESVDSEGDAITYTLANDAGGRFAISAEGQLIVANPGAIDFEASASHTVRVRATDAHGAFREQDFVIAVQDGNEANSLPASYSLSVNENVTAGTVVGSVVATDVDQSGVFATQRYYFWNGTTTSATSSDGRYAINAVTGEIIVNTALNFEAGTPSKTYQVVARDNAGAAGYNQVQSAVTIGIADVNEANSLPASYNLTVNENVAVGTVVGSVAATDLDNAGTTFAQQRYYFWNAGAASSLSSDGRYEIDALTGTITTNAALDFEAGTASATYQVVAQDNPGGAGYSQAQTVVTIGIVNLNEANSLPASYNMAVNENIALGTVVGSVTATDMDSAGVAFGQQRYYFWDGTTASATSSDGRYAINATTGQITVNAALNFEAGTPSKTYQVIARDNAGGAGYHQAQSEVTIAIADLNEAPVSLNWAPLVAQVVERDRVATGTARPAIALGTLSVTDPDTSGLPSAVYSYTVSDSRFEVVGNTLRLKQDASFDYEAGASVTVTVTGTDGTGTPFTIDRTIVIAVTDIDDIWEGSGGADVIVGQSGRDIMSGFAGTDTLSGGAGNDSLDGGDGADTLHGDDGADLLLGRLGDDLLHGGLGNDILRGGEDDDQLFGEDGDDSLYGDAGAEGVRADGSESWRGFAQAGLVGGIGDDLLDGGAGDDYLDGGAGADQLIGGDGFDGADYGGSNAAVTVNLETGTGIGGHAQGDTLSGIELVQGSGFGDTITGSAGTDVIYGGAGNDTIYGGAGNDYLFGGDGNDTIDAQAGDDVLDGGAGNDILNGGIDNDLYVVTRSSGADTINNYDPSGDDVDVIGFNDAMGAINDQDLWFERIGDDLKISVIGTGSSISVTDWYVVANPDSRANHKIDFIVANTSFSRTINIEGLVTLMATKTKPATTAARDTLMADLTYKAMWATHWNSNATPTLSAIAQQSTNEDLAKVISVTATDDITPNTQLQLSAQVISGTNVVTNAGISFGTPNSSGVRSMTINPVANASGTARIRVTATDAGGISSSQEFDIVVAAVADAPTVTQFTSAGGTSGQAGGIALNLATSFPDADGSETHQIWITGVPSGVTLSAGTYDSASATWRLTPAQLGNLKVNAPAGWSQDLNLTATARATENGQTAISAPANLKLVVNTAPTGITIRGLGSSATPWVYEYTPSNDPAGQAVGTAAVVDPDAPDNNLFPADFSELPLIGIGEERIITATGPSGSAVEVLETGQNGDAASQRGGGLAGFSMGPADISKAYKFTIYFKPENNMGHSLYFGTLGSVQNAWDGQTNSNPYFYTVNSDSLVQDRWYRIEAYILPAGSALIDINAFGGVFDTVTGAKIANTKTFRFSENGSDTAARFFSFYNETNAGYSAQWYQPTVERLDYSYQLLDSAGGRFAINSVTGLITATGANLNHEANTTHNITVRVTDAFGAYRDQTIAVAVNNLNEANSLPSSYSMAVNENAAAGTLVGTVTATDIDSAATAFGQQRYYFLNGATASATSSDGRYAIDATTGKITVNGALNFEAGTTSATYTVIARDNAGAAGYTQVQSNVTIAVNNVNEQNSLPASYSFGVNENSGIGTIVGTVVATDLDVGGAFASQRYYFLNGTTASAISSDGRYTINATTGQITTYTALNYEAGTPSATYTVIARDNAGTGAYTQDQTSVTIGINNLNEANNIAASYSFGVNENVAVGTAVGTVTATDLDSSSVAFGQQRYYFLNGTTASATSNDGRYKINATTGQITTNAALNHEAGTPSATYAVIVRDNAGAAGYHQDQTSVTIGVNNVNEANSIGASYSFAVNENVGIGTAVGTVAASDIDSSSAAFGQQRYYFLNGVTASSTSSDGRYTINATTGQITTKVALNYEAGTPSATYTVIARDNAGAAGYNQVQTSVTIGINNLNEANSLPASYSMAVNENVAVGTAVGTVAASDIDSSSVVFGQQRYYFLNGTTASATSSDGRYKINATTGQITTNIALNYEAGSPSGTYAVIARDNAGAAGYNQDQSNVTIAIGNVDEPHTMGNLAINVNESNTALGPYVSVGNFLSMFDDPENGANIQFRFTNGSTQMNGWQIDPASGQIWMISAKDYEALTDVYENVMVRDYPEPEWEWRRVGKDPSRAIFNLGVVATNSVTDASAQGTLTINVKDVNEDVTHSSYITGSSKGTWIKISNTEYRILADTSAVTRYITPSVFDPEGQAVSYYISGLDYEEYNIVAGGSSQINASAMPTITINSSGQIGFHVPNQDWDGEWEGGLKIGGYRRTSSVDATFILNIVNGDITTQVPMKITFVRRGSSVPPIVFDLDGDGLEITPADGSTVQFDMDGDGIRDTTGWAGADDGFLALDRNGNGLIDDISEISFVADVEGAMSDLEGLRAYDSDGDGYFDDGDAQFASFLIWRDENHDGVSQAHEMKTLAEWGIRAINLSMTLTGNADEGDNILFATTDYEKVDGTTGTVGDVFLSFDPSNVDNVAPPIVLDFDGDGKSLTDMADNKVRFDMNGDGIADKTGWIEQGDAFLALDRNGNDKIDDIKEISFVADKEGAKTDLEGLAAFDSNADGQLNGDDARFAEFRLWFDNNGNGQTDAGELLSLAQAGVVSVSLTGVATGEQTVSGKNIVYNTGGFTRANGETGKLLDVGLGFKPLSIFPEIEFQQSAWQGKAKGYRLQASSGTVRVVPRDPKGILSADAGQIADAATLSFGNMNISMLSAILLDLDGDGLEAKRAGKSKARFDMNGDGLRDDTGWMSGGDGMLVIDRDKDGVINQASEFSFLSEKEGAKNSWEGLAALDSNKDGKLDKADTRFGELKVWADRNGDGISQADEIKTLADLDIAEIGLRSSATSDSVKVGRNLALSTATYKRENGATATIGNVALSFDPAKRVVTRPAEPGDRPDILPIDAARAASNLAQAMSRFGADVAEGDLRNVPKDGMALNDWFTAAVA